jgi:hypothetical protein
VAVTEGVVSVRWHDQEVRLLPGEEWPTGCAAPRPAPARPAARRPQPQVAPDEPVAPREEAPPAPEPEAATPVAPARPQRAPVPQTPSMLAAQNDLFSAAVRAKRRGHAADAIRLFGTLVRKYPDSPLAESALAQRMKLLAANGPEAAVEAANDYLEQFPGGFARADARAIVRAAAKP